MIPPMGDDPEQLTLEYHRTGPIKDRAPIPIGRAIAFGYVALCVLGLLVMGMVEAARL